MQKELLKKLLYTVMPLRWIINHNFNGILHRQLNWKDPKDINEKINWLKLYGNTTQWSYLADKYKVREYVKSKGLGDILIPQYDVYEQAKDIDFSKLPERFVLKTNHGSGDCIIVKNKSEIDEHDIRKKLKKALDERYGLYTGEPHYLKIKPLIIAEALLDNNELGFTTSLIDYKVWCFDGKPYSVWSCYSRTKKHTYVNTFDLEWNCHPETSVFNDHYRNGEGKVPKPKLLNEMLRAAATLSQGFPVVRVDFYEVKGHLYFGEMTFTSNGGYMDYFSDNYLLEMGKQIVLRK